MRTLFFPIIIVLLTIGCKEKNTSIKPGEIWPDNNGVHINAHGGGLLEYNGNYIWYGEHKIEGEAGNQAHVGVHCYSSKDLYNWKDEGIALAVHNDTNSLLVKGCIIERPKVIYNKKTGKFVMWFHHELKGQGYNAALTGLAISDKATGPFEYIKSLNPNKEVWPMNFPDEWKQDTSTLLNIKPKSEKGREIIEKGYYLRRDFQKGQMARDMTLFVDDDGTAYHIHSSESNQTLHVAELTDDYTDFTGRFTRILPGASNEAPAIFKRKGKYYLISSGCTGWDPNPARLAVADNIFGPWTPLGNPCRGDKTQINTTFQSQSTYILKVNGKEDAYIFMADRWMPKNAIDGRYIWLPIKFDENDIPFLEWMDEWDLQSL
jgi:beta-xylosidase